VPNGKFKPAEDKLDPRAIEKLLELELMQKRADWQHAKTRRAKVRALAYFFLLLVIAAAFVAFFLLFSQKAGAA
jgi:hypothetical protein